MPRLNLCAFTTEEIEQMLAVHKGELLKTQQQFSHDGSSVTKRQLAETREIINSCQAELERRDPEKYPSPRRVAVSSVDRPLGT